MGANVDDRGSKGDLTPLMDAASQGHVEIVKLLISHGAEVNAQSACGKCQKITIIVVYNLKLIYFFTSISRK
jgi:ankyrin repeat protein